MGGSPRCSKDSDLNRGSWTAMEDFILREYITIHGEGGWGSLPRKAGLKRSGKSCRMRWLNYLRPDIKRGNISTDEEELIIRLHGLLGNRWSLIAGRLPGRTDNEVKNYWNTQLSKKILAARKTPPKHQKHQPKSNLASTAGNRVLKSTPVKATSLRIAKGCNKYGSIGNSNHQDLRTTDTEQTVKISRSWSELLLEELMTEDDSDLFDFTMRNSIVELGSPSFEYNGQYSPRFMPSSVDSKFPHSEDCSGNEFNGSESLLYLNNLPSSQCNLLSPEDFRIEELEAKRINCLEQTNDSKEQVDSFTVAMDEGIHMSSMQQGDWAGELQYLQTSSLQLESQMDGRN